MTRVSNHEAPFEPNGTPLSKIRTEGEIENYWIGVIPKCIENQLRLEKQNCDTSCTFPFLLLNEESQFDRKINK